MAALERFSGKGLRLVIMNPSLLLGPGDDRLSSTKVVLDFMARKIGAVPNGGLNFVDVRDTAQAFRVAMQKGRHGERYLLGAVNWTFLKFFDRLERLTKVASPHPCRRMRSRWPNISGISIQTKRVANSASLHAIRETRSTILSVT